jgi:hypothetical protein
MVDVDTFLTTLYVMVDDFCKTSLPLDLHPGPQAALSRSEVVPLALFGQWQGSHSIEFSGGEVQACTDSPPKSGFVG